MHFIIVKAISGKKVFLVLLLPFLGASCSSVDKHAKEAAQLTNKSIQAASNHNLDDSQAYYSDYKKIEGKYKGKAESKKFAEAYSKYIKVNKTDK